MTSVNKIKELAEAREYSLAVEILDSQNLEKSLNPQFLRVCGEIYENVGRLADARNMYVKAHIMGPESNRILFSIITFYLKQGYFDLAEQYQEQYIANAKGNEQEISKLTYVIRKSRHAGLDELRGLLEPYYTHALDEEWSFELFLLMTMQGEDTEILAADYKATFRRSNRLDDIQDVTGGKKKAEDLFWIYAKEKRADNRSEEEEIRTLEKEQLKKDYLRLHPAALEEEQADTVSDPGVDSETAEILEESGAEKKFKSFLKRKFRKKNADEADAEETDGKASDGEVSDQQEGSGDGSEAQESAVQESADNGNSGEQDAEIKDGAADTMPADKESDKDTDKKMTDQGEGSAGEATSGADSSVKPEPDSESVPKDESSAGTAGKTDGSTAPELKTEPEKDPDAEAQARLEQMISVDFDDGFAAETDDISALDEVEEEADQSPLSILNLCAAIRQEEQVVTEEEPEALAEEEPEAVVEKEPEAVTEPEPGLIIDEEPEEGFGDEEPISWEETETQTTEAEPEPIVEEEPEPIAEEEPEPIAEAEPEPIVEEEPEPIAEEEPEPIVEEEPEPIVEEEPEPIAEEEPEPIAEAEPEPIAEAETEPIAEEEPEPIAEAETEPIVEEEPEPIAEEEPEPITEEEPEPIAEAEPEPIAEEEREPIVEEEPEPIAEKAAETEKTTVDALAENEKLDEGLLEEERLQREAEALLASLGIKL